MSKMCPLPWISMETTPMGGCRPCCLAKEEVPGIDLNIHTMKDAYNSDYMKDLRQEFIDGKQPKTCSRCWEEEAAGKTSKRMNTKVRLKELMPLIDYTDTEPDTLWFLDLKLGNTCNLKCRICGSWSSSKWAKEEMDSVEGDPKKHVAYEQLKKGAWPKENEQFWINLDALIPDVKYMEFTGGEPFLIPELASFIRNIDARGRAPDIELHFNTNGTVDHRYIDFHKFKKVEIAYSIDNVGKRFEYERYGAKWNDIEANINKGDLRKLLGMKPSYETQLCFTINIQNVYYIDELLIWAEDRFDSIHWNFLHDPWHMNVQYMTPEAKEIVLANIHNHQIHVLPQYKQKFLELAKYIENGPGSDGTEFCRYMKKSDKYRQQNLLDTHPEIGKAMGYE